MQFDFKCKAAVYLTLGLSLCLLSGQVRADGFLISNPKTILTKDEVKDAFLGEKQLASGVRLILVDNSNEQEEFLSKFLELRKVKYESLWAKKSFSLGLSPPLTKMNDAETIETVKNTSGGVGYVKSQPPEGVTVIGKFGDSSSTK